MPRRSARERILEASTKLFAERGFRHTTTKMIADYAGVNEVTLFRHFGTKEGIVKAIIQTRAPMLGEVRRILGESATGDMYEDLLKMAKLQFKYISANLQLVVNLIQESIAGDDMTSFVSFLPRSLKEILMDYFARMQASGTMRPVDIEKAAVMFMTPQFGLAFMKGFFGDAVTNLPPEDHIESAVRNFVNAVQS